MDDRSDLGPPRLPRLRVGHGQAYAAPAGQAAFESNSTLTAAVAQELSRPEAGSTVNDDLHERALALLERCDLEIDAICFTALDDSPLPDELLDAFAQREALAATLQQADAADLERLRTIYKIEYERVDPYLPDDDGDVRTIGDLLPKGDRDLLASLRADLEELLEEVRRARLLASA